MGRRLSWRAISIHRSYDVAELARLLKVDRRTVRRWMDNGLRSIRDARPFLILGADLVEFLSGKKKPKARCGPGEMFCFRCQLARQVAFRESEIAHASPVSLNLRALCGACSAVMHRRVSRARIGVDMPGVTIRDPQAERHLSETV